MKLILDNCTVFDGHSPELREGASIRVEEGEIREIADRPIPAQDGVRRIDAAGRFVMPGLIDAHFHCYGFDLNLAIVDAMPPALRALNAKRVMEDALQRGFTTVRDAAGGDYSLARGVQTGLIKGPRLFYPGLAISQTGGHGDMRSPGTGMGHHAYLCACAYCGALSMVADGEDEVRKAVREQLRQGAHHIKIFVSGGVLSPSDPLWMDQMNEAEIRVAVAEAKTRRTYVMAHAHTAEGAVRAARCGVRSIEHGTLMDEASVREVMAHDAFVVPTLGVIDALLALGPTLGLDAVALAKAGEVAHGARTALAYLHAAGARIGFGTDLLGTTMERQSLEFGLRREVMPALDILRSATRVNAELIQMTGRLGCVAEGAIADLIMLDGNPLDDIRVLEDPARMRLVMREGRIFRNTLD